MSVSDNKIWLLSSVILSLFPLFLLINCDHNTSSESVTVSNSNTLWGIQLSSFFASLPMLFDSLLDFSLQYSGCSLVEYIQRMVFIALLLIPSILYLVYHARENYAYFHVVITTFSHLVISSLVYSTVKGVMIKEPNKYYVLALEGWIILYQFCILLEELCFFNQWMMPICDFSIILAGMSVITFAVPVLWWMINSFQFSRATSINTSDYQQETNAAVISVAYGLFVTFEALWPSVDYGTFYWTSEAEKTLVGNSVAHILFTIVVTVLPGRITRINAVLSTELMALKRVFVRYASHEIRSPLNIVHAGLEVLRSEFQEFVLHSAVCNHQQSSIAEQPEAGFSPSENLPPLVLDLGTTKAAATNVDKVTSIATTYLVIAPSSGIPSPSNDSQASRVCPPVMNKAASSILELLDDIFQASDSSINILNDLLHYEHLDAGNFKLELSWRPLMKLFHGKFDWVIVAAKKKGVSFAVTDSAMCSEYAVAVESSPAARSPTTIERTAWDDNLSLETVCLQIDVYKIEQVLRNLIVHALKFTNIGGLVSLKMSYRLAGSDKNYKIITKMGVDAVGVFRVEVVGGSGGITGVDDIAQFGALTDFNKEELRCEGGSGLSLWIARRIIYLHKGTMGCQYDVSNGTRTVFFELPLYPASSMSSSQPQFLSASLQRSLHGPSVREQRNQQPLPAMSMSALLAKNSVHHLEHVSSCLAKSTSIGGSVESQVGDSSKQSVESISPSRVSSCSTDSTVEDSTGGRISANFTKSQDFFPVPILSSANLIRSSTSSSATDILYKGVASECEEKVSSAAKGPDHANKNLPRPLRFLIVDDSALNRKMILRVIQSEKEHVRSPYIREADDGATAIDEIQHEVSQGGFFDFILMDYVMIRMHGPDAAAYMRNELRYTGTIIGVTGNALPDDIAKYISCGVNEVITKPLTREKLIGTLAKYPVN